MQKTVSGTTTSYVFSGTKVIAEYVGGNLSKECVYAGSQLLATMDAGSSTTTYQHPDHLSTRAESDLTGAVTRTFGQFPFGEVWYETGTASKWKFTSYERDSETGLDYARGRYSSNAAGRFMHPDPLAGALVNPQSLNRYAYVTNDPINATDPSGLQGTKWINCLLDQNGNCMGGGGQGPGGLSWKMMVASLAAFFGKSWYDLPGNMNPVAQAEWKYKEDFEKAINAKNYPDSEKEAQESDYTIWVYCDGTVSSGVVIGVQCDPPPEAVPGSLPYIFGMGRPNGDVTTPGIEALFHAPGMAQQWNAASTVANPKFYAYWTATAAVPGVIYNWGPLSAAGSELWMNVEAASPGATLRLMDVINVATPPWNVPTTLPGAVAFGWEVYNWWTQ